MADVLVLEFSTPDARQLYGEVSGILGTDPATGKGDWPSGIESHVAGELDGKFIVVEVWSSKGAQESFMQERLGPALAKANAPEPTRVQWFDLIGQKTD